MINKHEANKMNKYNYYKVIQGNYGYGWEDVDYHASNSQGMAIDNKTLKHNLKEYRASGIGSYRVIFRKELR